MSAKFVKYKKPAARKGPWKELWIFGLTGGPCSGKSKTIKYKKLKTELQKMGIEVIIPIIEYATHVIENYVPDIKELIKKDPSNNRKIQKIMFLAYMAMYNTALQTAALHKNKKVVIISDRSIMDIAAYCTAKDFKQILREVGMTMKEAHGLVDAVIHLVTAAIGAEKAYSNKNNKARREDLEQARKVEAKTLKAWSKHPSVHVVDNSTNFRRKKERVVKAICGILAQKK